MVISDPVRHTCSGTCCVRGCRLCAEPSGLAALSSGRAGLPGRRSGKGAGGQEGLKAKKIRAEKAEIHGQSSLVWQSLRSSE